MLNHFSVGGVATLILTGGYAVVAFVGPLNLANLSRGRWGSRRNRDENLQATLALLLVVGLCFTVPPRDVGLPPDAHRRAGRARQRAGREQARAERPSRRSTPSSTGERVLRRGGAPTTTRAARRWWLFGLLGSAAAQSTYTVPRWPSGYS